jgi:hypothetical protein
MYSKISTTLSTSTQCEDPGSESAPMNHDKSLKSVEILLDRHFSTGETALAHAAVIVTSINIDNNLHMKCREWGENVLHRKMKTFIIMVK